MKAWRIHEYGGAEAMRFDDVPMPEAGEGEILIRVVAASVNPVDWKIREGWLAKAFPVPLPRTLGRDAAGTVVAVAPGATGVAVGDVVMGLANPSGNGTHAEYAFLRAMSVAAKPAALSAADAASLGVSGLSAYIPLIEDAKVARGMRVLIHAGAGGVGSLAIQIAKHVGAEVFTTCSEANRAYVESLGADHVIDYTRESSDGAAAECDVILDTLGGEAHNRSLANAKSGSILVCLSAAPIVNPPQRADVKVVRSQITPTRERLAAALALAASGAIKPQVSRTFPLEQARDAYSLVQSGHARGKVVLVAES